MVAADRNKSNKHKLDIKIIIQLFKVWYMPKTQRKSIYKIFRRIF